MSDADSLRTQLGVVLCGIGEHFEESRHSCWGTSGWEITTEENPIYTTQNISVTCIMPDIRKRQNGLDAKEAGVACIMSYTCDRSDLEPLEEDRRRKKSRGCVAFVAVMKGNLVMPFLDAG